MQWVACMVPNTAYTTHQLPAKAVFSSDQRRREGMRRGVKNACCLCFADAAPTLQCCQITALAFQLNQLIQILVRTTCVDPLLKRLILINVWSVHVLSDIILKYSQMIDIFALKPLLSARWWTHPLCLVPTPHQGMEVDWQQCHLGSHRSCTGLEEQQSAQFVRIVGSHLWSRWWKMQVYKDRREQGLLGRNWGTQLLKEQTSFCASAWP